MEKFYIRAQDIEQKIHSVKLPYLAWKVLFLLGEKQTVDTLADLLGEEKNNVEKALTALNAEGLISEVQEETSQEELREATALVEEEGTLEEVEEAPPAESEKSDEALEAVAEEPAAQPETLEAEPAIPEEEPQESELESVEKESAEEAPAIEDFDLGELQEQQPTEKEKSELESDITETEPEESSIEIPEVEEETEKLDLDFDEVEKQEAEPEPEPAKEEPAEKPKPVGAPTLLVVDDSIVIRKMVELALEGEDFILETATSGKEGLKALDQVKPDVVILDLMLPDINGIDLLKTIKASLNIPVIMLSGKDSPQMIEKAKAEGADAFLPKPFRDEDLVKTIHELLQK